EELGYTLITTNYRVFSKNSTFVAIYINDLLMIGKDKAEIRSLKDTLSVRF
ncbi:hypothetical protein NEUTE2DRAFT_75181, partial [Neurospora tetrasperma FGSC 2509]